MLIDGSAGLPTQKAVSVCAGADRIGAAMDIREWRFECKLSARDTCGELCVYDTVRSIRGGPRCTCIGSRTNDSTCGGGSFCSRSAARDFI